MLQTPKFVAYLRKKGVKKPNGSDREMRLWWEDKWKTATIWPWHEPGDCFSQIGSNSVETPTVEMYPTPATTQSQKKPLCHSISDLSEF